MADELSLDEVSIESPEAAVPPWAVRHRWIVLGALIFVQAGLGVLLFNPHSHGEDYLNASIGLLFSHPLLFALWAALAPHRFYVRFLWCLPLCSVLAFFVSLKNLMISNNDTPFMIIDLAIFFAATPILLLVRHFTGWQMKHVSGVDFASDYRPYQFGIKHIMLLTTVTALVLGLFRSLSVISDGNALPEVNRVLKVFSLILLMAAPILFIYWFSLVDFGIRRSSVFFAVIFMLLIELAIFIVAPPILTVPDRYRIITFFQIGCGLSVFLTALVIRWCGFRLVRRRRGE